MRIDTAAGATPPNAESLFATATAGGEVVEGATVELAGHSPPGRSMLIELTATAPSADAAQQAVAQATEAYLAAATGSRDQAQELAQWRDEARTKAVTSRVALMEAERKLNEFCEQHFDALEQAALPSPTTRPNPAWQELETQRQELEGRLKALLASQTPQHPEYRHVEGQIAAIRRQQQSIPQTLPADDAMLATAAQRAEVRQMHNDLRAAVDLARSAHSEAQREQQQATSAAAAAASAAAAVTAHIEQPARVASLQAARTSRNMLLAALLIALVLGTAVALFTPKRIRRRLMNSVSEVAAALRLPIVGVLGSGAGPARPAESNGRRRISRWLVTGSELVVVAALVLVLVGAVAWPGWANELQADPLSAVQQAVLRVVSGMPGR